ncbi:MAG: P1 family peptidase, partial [Cyanobacteria bacterium HKST-UBA06]|nr:P1 family peptidase [Cyanobacteria bacterium HKST-UBA06]
MGLCQPFIFNELLTGASGIPGTSPTPDAHAVLLLLLLSLPELPELPELLGYGDELSGGETEVAPPWGHQMPVSALPMPEAFDMPEADAEPMADVKPGLGVSRQSFVESFVTGTLPLSDAPLAPMKRYVGNEAHRPLLGSTVNSAPVPINLADIHQFKPGVYNAITDVPGIKVGQVTLVQPGADPIQTGITAVVPDMARLTNGQGNLATYGLSAYGDAISGYGEMTGLYGVRTLGVMNAPVIMTNTRAVGRVYSGVGMYYRKHFPGLWRTGLPIVGECWDGRYNTINTLNIEEQDAVEAIESASSGPVLQGRVGAGRGMRSFGLQGGLGSSSRQFEVGGKTYTVGVLVNSNHGQLEYMPQAMRDALTEAIGDVQQLSVQARAKELKPVGQEDGGSIVIVMATDLPMTSDQLALLVARATAGLAMVGSRLSITSGDFAIAFSTAKPVPLEKGAPPIQVQTRLSWDELNTLFDAAVEAVAEAQINALVAGYGGGRR